MTIKIVGDMLPVKRLITGLYSFDNSFINSKGDVGLPLGKGIEWFGSNNVGKSTTVYGLAGLIAKELNKNIALVDFEGFDPDLFISLLENAKFDGEVRYIQREDDEESLEELLVYLRKPEYAVGIIDSIGAISPIAEQSGDLGEANMGKRAFLMAQFSRKATKILRSNDDKTVFAINHAYPKIGGRGMDTPGGEVKKFLLSIRIQVRRVYWKGKYEEYPDGSYVIEGTVVKNRWGLKDKIFHLFVLSGRGIHKGLTAMYDAKRLGLVTVERNVVKIGDTSFGKLPVMVKEAKNENEKFFEPFFDILQTDNTEIDNYVETENTNEEEIIDE